MIGLLAPLAPPTHGQLSGDRLIGHTFEWTAVQTLRSTLRWQAFPRPTDVARAPEDMARVRNVRYDPVVAFELDGRHRLTEWCSKQYMARAQFTAPSRFSYRFRTPGSP